MSEQNKPSLWQRWKDTKINRAAVMTVLVLIVAIILIVSVTIASNRAKKNQVQPDVDLPKDTPTTEVPKETEKPIEQPKPETPQNNKEPSTDVEDKLPSFILPVNGALSKTHDTELQVFSPTMKDYRVHLGVDIVTNENAPVYAAADGTVSRIWEDVRMGYCMAIKHSGDCYTIYKNLSETLPEGIAVGTAVRSGQLIASVGESAMVEVAEEPHLHFEMTVGDLLVDPLEYFDEKALESLKMDASYGE